MAKIHTKEKHTFSDFIYWIMILAIPMATGLLAIYKHSKVWFTAGIFLFAAMAGVLLRFFCTHCPHYLKEEKRLKCMFFWEFPKTFAPRPGPYRFVEKAAVYAACLVIFVFPLYWLFFETGLLVIYMLSYTVFFITLKKNECWRCAHENCPLNAVVTEG